MCGIFGYVGYRKKAANLVLDGLKSLEYRGYDSWGVAAMPINKSTLSIKKRTGKIGAETVKDMPASTFAFGHTRWATHGGVTEINAHPHLDCTGKIALIHNGIIENYEEIKKTLLKKGHLFISDTDTEVAVHLIEEYAKKYPLSKAVQKAFGDIKGLNAFIVLGTKDHQLIAVRNGSPLVVGFGSDENFIASDALALLPYTKQVHFLEDNQLAIIDIDKILLFDAITGQTITPIKQHLDWSIERTVKGKYPYFMIKEIHEQPGIIADIAANYSLQAQKLAQLIRKSYGAYMVGCGTAAYACMAGAYIFSKISNRHVNWAIGSEFGYQQDFLSKKSLVIALSQSGETMDTIEAIKKSRDKGAYIYALVNVLGSSIYRMADDKILLGAGPEKAVASTKAFTAKLAHILLVAAALTNHVEYGQKILTDAVKSSQKILHDASIRNIRKLAEQIKNAEHMYVIGRGLSYPASLEVALKIKEVSYIHAEGLAAGELKHGPLALIDKGTPCIAFLPNDETYGANLAGAQEMKARGGYIIGISNKPNTVFDYYIPVMDASEATIIPNVIAGQILAYELSRAKGLDPDKPRNLAKSVTVK